MDFSKANFKPANSSLSNRFWINIFIISHTLLAESIAVTDSEGGRPPLQLKFNLKGNRVYMRNRCTLNKRTTHETANKISLCDP